MKVPGMTGQAGGQVQLEGAVGAGTGAGGNRRSSQEGGWTMKGQ